jgi:maltose O-acetyltransferase
MTEQKAFSPTKMQRALRNALGRIEWRGLVRDTLFSFVSSPVLPRSYRPVALRWLGADVRGAVINAGGFYGGSGFRFADGVFVNYGVFFDCTEQITLEKDVSVGMQVTFITSSHAMGPAGRRAGPPTSGPIRVGAGSWIGARSTILPGVTIGEGCVIAAGALVSKDCDAGGLYAGVPARLLRQLDESSG